MIALNDALGVMGTGEPFSIKYVTANRSKKTGGKVIFLPKAVKVGASHNQKDNETITLKQLGNDTHPYPIHIHLILEFNNQKVHI